jgi:hypothetical protein
LDYGAYNLPHVVLIDKEGKIAYRGDPTWINLEQNIESLLKGEKITVAANEDEKD